MKTSLILETLPPWLIIVILVGFFGIIVVAVILVKKFAKPFKSDEKPKSDKEIANEEVMRLTQELDEEEYQQAKENKERKAGKPTEEEALQEEMDRILQPVEDEETAEQIENYSETEKDGK